MKKQKSSKKQKPRQKQKPQRDVKSKTLVIKMTESEYAQIEANAAIYGNGKVSTYMRERALEG